MHREEGHGVFRVTAPRRDLPAFVACGAILLASTFVAGEEPAAPPPAPAAASGDSRSVGPVPDELRKKLDLSPFYVKHVSAGGLPVLSSAKVSDFALLEAAYLLDRMFEQRPDVRQAMTSPGSGTGKVVAHA
jgi:hypothetical protein